MSGVAAVLARLFALAPRGMRHGLDPMREACALEGDPQDAVAAIHIAGTNGKGSVAASIDAIARAAGLRTGLYTSPHLGRFAERIRIDGEPIADAALEEGLTRALDRYPALTFFEIATLVAFEAFRAAKVDLAVLEVGLGGRLDATNVVAHPLVTAITTIGLDHTAILGDTIAAIAGEKAGILKAGVPLVVGRVPAAAAEVIEARARDVSAAPLWRLGHELTYVRTAIEPAGVGRAARVGSSDEGRLDEFRRLHLRGPNGLSLECAPSLAGAHQDDNAAVAIGVSWALRLSGKGVAAAIDDDHIARGLSAVRWPGRLEEVRVARGALEGAYLLDGAHNEEGARALGEALDARATRGARRRVLVFGAMADKPWSAMLRELAGRFEARVYVAPTASGGGRSAAEVDALVAADPGSTRASSLHEALVAARLRVGRDGLIVVAGSLYLVGEARSILLGAPRDPHVGL